MIIQDSLVNDNKLDILSRNITLIGKINFACIKTIKKQVKWSDHINRI